MGKLILIAVLVVSIAVPLRAALDPNPRRGLRRALLQTLVLDALYAVAILFVYPRI